jgi:hypothetical protein
VKHDRRKLEENSVSLGDIAKVDYKIIEVQGAYQLTIFYLYLQTMSHSYEMTHDIASTQEGLAMRMTSLEHQLSDIQKELGGITEMLKMSLKTGETTRMGNNGNNMGDSLRRRRHVIEST